MTIVGSPGTVPPRAASRRMSRPVGGEAMASDMARLYADSAERWREWFSAMRGTHGWPTGTRAGGIVRLRGSMSNLPRTWLASVAVALALTVGFGAAATASTGVISGQGDAVGAAAKATHKPKPTPTPFP